MGAAGGMGGNSFKEAKPSGKVTTIPVMSRYKSVPSVTHEETVARHDQERAAQFQNATLQHLISTATPLKKTVDQSNKPAYP